MKKVLATLSLVSLVGCAGFQRSCQSGVAQSFGADWLIVQYQFNGEPTNCWQLRDKSVANEEASDGVYWTTNTGHLVHISGWYNRIQVNGNDFEGAAKEVGIDLSKCIGGKYIAKTSE